MIGADIMMVLFGAGLLALAGLMGRVAVTSARATRLPGAIVFGVGTVVGAFIGLYCVATGLLRMFAG